MRKITPELIAQAKAAGAARRAKALTEQIAEDHSNGTVENFMQGLREDMAEARKAS
jgi:hypothetical protein